MLYILNIDLHWQNALTLTRGLTNLYFHQDWEELAVPQSSCLICILSSLSPLQSTVEKKGLALICSKIS